MVRKGTKKDIPALLALITELAIYEKAPNEVVVTKEILLSDGFGKDKIFDFFVYETKNGILGIALYYTKYSTWKGKCIYLEDIVVSQQHRQKGVGSKLFDAVLEVAKNKKVKRMEWPVLDWNEPAIKFYKKYNAILDEEWINGKFEFK